MSTTASKHQRAATVGSRLILTACTRGPAQPGRRTPCQWTLRHDSDVNDLDMQHNGHVNNITKNCTCGISTVCTQTALNVPVSEHNGHVELVQELHLWDLHGLYTDSTERTCL